MVAQEVPEWKKQVCSWQGTKGAHHVLAMHIEAALGLSGKRSCSTVVPHAMSAACTVLRLCQLTPRRVDPCALVNTK